MYSGNGIFMYFHHSAYLSSIDREPNGNGSMINSKPYHIWTLSYKVLVIVSYFKDLPESTMNMQGFFDPLAGIGSDRAARYRENMSIYGHWRKWLVRWMGLRTKGRNLPYFTGKSLAFQ